MIIFYVLLFYTLYLIFEIVMLSQVKSDLSCNGKSNNYLLYDTLKNM